MAELDARVHFRILEDIARDLSGDINFPTCMDAAILVRNILRDPLANIERVVQVIGIEPLISSKLLRLANSVSYNPSGQRLTDLKKTIERLGFEVVRTTSLAVAMDQMLKSRKLATYDDLACQTWEHSLQVAAIARVLARRIGRVNPDEAMLAGLVHDIGVFYLLFRAPDYAEYRDNRDAMIDLLDGWHESIGESLLHILNLPEHIVEAVRDHDQPQHVDAPSNIRDILYFANLLAEDSRRPAESHSGERGRVVDLLEEAADDIRELRAALAT